MPHVLRLAILLMSPALLIAEEKKIFLNSDEAGLDFKIQGEYTGNVGGEVGLGVQIVADGAGRFRTFSFVGGLPGDGWEGEERRQGKGEIKDGIAVFDTPGLDGGRATWADEKITVYDADDNNIGTLRKVHRKSATLGKEAPEGAVVLFDGSTPDNFKGGRMTDDKLLMEGVTSKATFGSYKLHLEFQLSFMPFARGQGRANSGCYHQGRYEVQILDSFGLDGKNNECGGIYSIAPPKLNMCFPPLSWQTYDVEFHAAEFDGDKKTKNAWVTVKHNNVVIHEQQELGHRTTASPLTEGPEDGPIHLQNHGNPIRFRNIWVLPIDG